MDALLAAAFTAFVCEGPLTGPGRRRVPARARASGEATFLDCFFGVPATQLGEMEELVIDFADAGTQVFHVGPGSVAVPDCSRAWRRRTGASRVARGRPLDSALELARGGFERDEPRQFLHGILAGVLLRDEGGRRIYGDAARVVTADCCATLESVRDVGAAAGRRAPARVRRRLRRLRGARATAARRRRARLRDARDAHARRRRRARGFSSTWATPASRRSPTSPVRWPQATAPSEQARCPGRHTSPSSMVGEWRRHCRRRSGRDPVSSGQARSSTTCWASST